jgi:hypothetical protein
MRGGGRGTALSQMKFVGWKRFHRGFRQKNGGRKTTFSSSFTSGPFAAAGELKLRPPVNHLWDEF